MTDTSAADQRRTASRPHILVGIDGSAGSLAALRQAQVLATALSGSVEAVCIWEYPATLVGLVEWSGAADARAILDDAVAVEFGSTPPSWVQKTVIEGGPARSLVELSADADLLVVGSRGHGGFAGLLLGSVSSVCAEHSSCPVLIVHGEKILSRSAM